MGKSNPIVFGWYRELLPKRRYERIALLGATQLDGFTGSIDHGSHDCFDLTLDNWKINDDWNIEKGMYDLVVCTRCPYFAEDPKRFVERCLELVRPGGVVFLDWGLGDHWRKEKYLVGWQDPDTGTQEDVHYGSHVSKLWSCYWDPKLDMTLEAVEFLGYAAHQVQGGYDGATLTEIIQSEVPHVIGPDDVSPSAVELLTLWPQSPQLYIATVFVKDA